MSTPASWAAVRGEWGRNRRLRLGVAVVAAILALYLFLVLQDWRTSLAAGYADRTEHLYKMQSLAGQDAWLVRADDAARVRAALEAEIPGAATVGVAQAGAQGWLRDVADALGGDMRMQPGEPAPVEAHPGVWRVPVTLTGRLEPRTFMELLRRIESRTTLTVIEQAMVRNRANPTFSLTIVAYFRIEDVDDAAG